MRRASGKTAHGFQAGALTDGGPRQGPAAFLRNCEAIPAC